MTSNTCRPASPSRDHRGHARWFEPRVRAPARENGRGPLDGQSCAARMTSVILESRGESRLYSGRAPPPLPGCPPARARADVGVGSRRPTRPRAAQPSGRLAGCLGSPAAVPPLREMGGAPRNRAPRNHFSVWTVKPSGCHCTHACGGNQYRRVPTPLRSTSPFSDPLGLFSAEQQRLRGLPGVAGDRGLLPAVPRVDVPRVDPEDLHHNTNNNELIQL